jgi:Cys-tRNA(Pro)/Cys-tRNA(Cys) deacylase
MKIKTNAMRILEQKNISFEIKSYEFDEEFSDAQTTAQKINLPEEQVFKTIIMRNEHKQIFVFCVPSNSEVNLKKCVQ